MIVYWTPFCDYKDGNIQTPENLILFGEPEFVYKNIVENRVVSQSSYYNCPAFVDICKNTFIIKCPYDLEMKYDYDSNYLMVNVDEDVIDSYCINRNLKTGFDEYPKIFTLLPRYIFYSKEDIIIETMPCFLQNHDKGFDLIPGRFNINKWIRPIDFTFELHKNIEKLKFKAGDPLFYIRFITPHGEKVELERTDMSYELFKISISSTKIKNRLSNTSLKTLYKMADSFVKLFLKKQN